MRTFARLALTLGAFALIAGPARAQGPAAPPGSGGWLLLSNKGVQKELKLTDEQARKLEAFRTEAREMAREQARGLRDLPADGRRAKLQELTRSSNEALQKGLADTLKPEQVKRFEQIAVQAAPDAFGIPRVQEALKLTDDQKAQIKEINEETTKSMRGLRDEFRNDREAAMKKGAEMRKGAKEKAAALLTDDQKKAWKELIGEPYEVKFEPGPNN